MEIKDRQIDITKIDLEIFNEINKLKKSKYRMVFEIMDDYYSKYLKQVEKLYIDKKINIKKELTNNYIFHITLLYDEILKNIYCNNRISIYILARSLVESLVKFVFIQKIDINICKIFMDYEQVMLGKMRLDIFNKKYNENVKKTIENTGLDICLKKIKYNTSKRGFSGILEFIMYKDKHYNLLFKHYKKYCKDVHVNLYSIGCNAYNYRKGRESDFDYILDIILLLNYTLYIIIVELHIGDFKNYITLQNHNDFYELYSKIGDKIMEII